MDEIPTDTARRKALLVLAYPIARRQFLEHGFRRWSVARPSQGKGGFELRTGQRHFREALDEPRAALRFLEGAHRSADRLQRRGGALREPRIRRSQSEAPDGAGGHHPARPRSALRSAAIACSKIMPFQSSLSP